MSRCFQCPRACGAEENGRGFCGKSGDKMRLALAAKHMWEEPIISGTRGSGAIFFGGCNLKCVYCQNYEISHGTAGEEIDAARLADIFKELEDAGVHNINLVTPSHYTQGIKRALDIYRPKLPVVFNCGGYESVDTIKGLAGYVDVYMPDLKYSDSALALRYSAAEDYFNIACAAVLEMKAQRPRDVIEDGLMKEGVIIRHLVLPSALANTKGVVDWLAENVDKASYISIMGQYIPLGRAAQFPELGRKLKPLEYKLAVEYALRVGFFNAYIQEEGGADIKFVPDFDGRGVAPKQHSK